MVIILRGDGVGKDFGCIGKKEGIGERYGSVLVCFGVYLSNDVDKGTKI